MTMINQENTAIIIPARLASTRLPNKPLLPINGKPMILHVWEQAVAAEIGKVIVATDSDQIKQVIFEAGGNCELTQSNHQSGTDRIYEALENFDQDKNINFIINLQGDLPQINRECLSSVVNLLSDEAAEVGTLVCEMTDHDEINSKSIVKAIADINPNTKIGRAINFTRTPEASINGNYLHHIGLYAYTRSALEKFVHLAPSTREIDQKLEQLRALDNQMRIDIQLIDFLPLGVDTPEDLEKMQKLI
ncbi:MAG: 3-deoxy-manno-octulosonate cytidylyltransferase [Candidatus Pelagibacterales bacterium]